MKILRYVIPVCVLLAAFSGCARTGGEEPPAVPSAETAVQAEAAEAFTDIAGHPSETYILEGLDRGFYTIPADGLYRPDEPASQGEFADAAWRMLGQPAPPNGVDGGGAAAWVQGYSDVYPYEPEEPVTRLAAVSLLFACNGSVSGTELMFTRLYDDGFKDSADIPPEGKPALYWGFYNVLIRETEPETISPSASVSRGDMAEILVRFMDDFRAEETDGSPAEGEGSALPG